MRSVRTLIVIYAVALFGGGATELWQQRKEIAALVGLPTQEQLEAIARATARSAAEASATATVIQHAKDVEREKLKTDARRSEERAQEAREIARREQERLETAQARVRLSEARNVARGKPVTVKTNGAEDNREGRGANICDGSVQHASGGGIDRNTTTCFQNNDYDQVMSATLIIQLQGRHLINRIRYNQGNVQRAETWNADSMESPLGSTPTKAGTTFQGVWTEQHGSPLVADTVTVSLKKTRTSYETDWLCVGEVEVYGVPIR